MPYGPGEVVVLRVLVQHGVVEGGQLFALGALAVAARPLGIVVLDDGLEVPQDLREPDLIARLTRLE